MSIYPPKLQKGDEIRIVAPSDSGSILNKSHIEKAMNKLINLGFKVSFSKNLFAKNSYNSTSPIQSRVEDLHQAFLDLNVKMILPIIGGYHSNQLLNYLDYELIKNNPKILGGYSDTTVLQNAIYSQTGIVTYSTIAFIMMSKTRNNQYSFDSFINCLTSTSSFEIKPPEKWDDSQWFINQDDYELYSDTDFVLIQKGATPKASNDVNNILKGQIIGGNLGSLRLLQGTKFFPQPNNNSDYIYFLESDSSHKAEDFARELLSLIQASNINKLKAIVIGRFQISSQITTQTIKQIISDIPELKEIPVIYNLPFGHTYPIMSFPIGGVCQINFSDNFENNKFNISILDH